MSEQNTSHHLFVVPKLGSDLELVCLVVDQMKIDLSQPWIVSVQRDSDIALVSFTGPFFTGRYLATFIVPDEDCGCNDD